MLSHIGCGSTIFTSARPVINEELILIKAP
jgi:hypothetical protein